MSPEQASSALRRIASEVDDVSSRSSVICGLAHLLSAVARPGLASLRPSVRADGFNLLGSDLRPFFHAGRALFEEVTTDVFFDGWYGWGFYAAFDPDYVRRWYGPVVTRLQAVPGAKVLIASISAYASPDGLLDKVMANEAAAISDEEKLREMHDILLENQLQWVHAVDRLAIEEYDIVVYSDEQIVVKNPDAVAVVGEELPSSDAITPALV